MDPGTFGVPGALLRPAGDSTTGATNDDESQPDSPVVPRIATRARVWDGLPAALVVLGLIGLGSEPVLAAVITVVAVLLVLSLRLLAPRAATVEERASLDAAGLPSDLPLAPVAATRLLPTAQRLLRRRGIRELLALAVPIGVCCYAVPLFSGRVLTRYENVATSDRLSLLLVAAVGGLLLSPSIGAVLTRASRRWP